MNSSSGMKRGLAATAISALAVTGLPFLALSASATPIASTFVDPDDIAFYSQIVAGLSDKNDGTNTTVSLVTGGGANVTSVLYQYESSTALGTWVDVPGGLVGRNADGVFAHDWSGVPDTVTRVRAVPNTGVVNAVEANAPTIPDATANTVELATEGSLGVFQEPYAGLAGDQDLVGVTGTVSEGSGAPTITDVSHTGNSTGTTLDPEPATATTESAASDTFVGVLDIDGYPYSPGSEPNQIALNAATSNTDDAEGSTLYVQAIGSITATPATQDDVSPADSTTVITVLDTTGEPVAGAEVYRGGDTDTDGGGADTDTDGAEELVGYTDGRGQIVADPAVGPEAGPGVAGTEKYYVNTTNDTTYQPTVDKATDVTVTTYTPTLGSVDIVNNRDRSNFDIDELSDGDDFTIATKDQKGNPYNEDLTGGDVQYRWVIDPTATGEPTYTTEWRDGETGADGKFAVPALSDAGDYDGSDVDTLANNPIPEGSYTLEARRPNVGGTGLMNAAPETFAASESEITYDEGASANAPVNGTYTVHGTLANDGGGLAGREIQLNYTPDGAGDADFAPQSAQPAGVDVTPDAGGAGSTATVVTDADGHFAVALRDQAVPANVTPTPETGTLNAIAEESKTDTTSLQGDLGPNDSTTANDADNAEQDLIVKWAKQADVSSITVGINTLDPFSPSSTTDTSTPGPGVPVDLDIVVHGVDGDANPDNDPALQDYPVTVTVDKGFLSPNAENANGVTLAAGHDATGDLWGFFRNDGTSKTLSTGDAASTGAVAAIERDAGFDDDGLVDMVVTITAGDKTVTRTVTFDDRWMINMADGSLERSPGEPAGDVPTSEDLSFDFFTHDQFGNLAGDQFARISDDSTVADFNTDEDFDQTLSDFTTSGPGIVAFSDAPTVQTLFAAVSPGEILVDANDDPDSNNRNVVVESDPINWVEPTVVKRNPGLVVRGRNNGAKDDNVIARAINLTAGATVKLFRKTPSGLKFIRKSTMNSKGNHKFVGVNDKNGRKYTKYVVKVAPTEMTNKGRGAKRLR